MAIASTARGYIPSTTMLFTFSVLMGLGVAVFQTALPAATRVWTPTHIALGNAVFLNGMMVGELSGAGLTLPFVLPMADGDWRTALMFWSIPIVLIALLVAFVRLPSIQDKPVQGPVSSISPQASLPRWNDSRVWQYGLLFAGSIVTFFAINAFVGTILRDRGESNALGGLLFAYNATPLLASFFVIAKPKWIGARRPIAMSALLSLVGLAGFTFLVSWLSWIAAFIAGLAATVELILLASLPATIATGRAVTRLNAGMTLVGYAIAFILPLIGGWLADTMQWTQMALIPSLVFTVVVLTMLGRARQYPKYE
jgi:CP family cyanate transporter-like MFS transporter